MCLDMCRCSNRQVKRHANEHATRHAPMGIGLKRLPSKVALICDPKFYACALEFPKTQFDAQAWSAATRFGAIMDAISPRSNYKKYRALVGSGTLKYGVFGRRIGGIFRETLDETFGETSNGAFGGTFDGTYENI